MSPLAFRRAVRTVTAESGTLKDRDTPRTPGGQVAVSLSFARGDQGCIPLCIKNMPPSASAFGP